MKRILMMIMCVVMAISLFGCGQSNEQKYMSLRNEVEKEMQTYDKVRMGIPDYQKLESRVPTKEVFAQKYLPYHENALKEYKAIQKRVLPKLEEMEKIAKDDLKLKKDYNEFGPRFAKILKDAIENREKMIKKWK